ncbi:MAG TPA: hypothetical protein VMF52_06535 [Steroidobacteraceae bacterium]|nr:hypothetical protein [Steroidobacteraceae bacterium]
MTRAATVPALLTMMAVAACARSAPPLQATFGHEPRGDFYFVELRNVSSDFACVSPQDFDTRRGGFVLTSASGQRATQTSFADGKPMLVDGFDYGRDFAFIPPGKTRRFYLDMSIFKVPAGEYTYELVADSFLCKDLADTGHHAAGTKVQGFPLRLGGKLQLSSTETNNK